MGTGPGGGTAYMGTVLRVGGTAYMGTGRRGGQY